MYVPSTGSGPSRFLPLSHDSRLPLCPTSLQPIVTFGTVYHRSPRQSQQTKLWRGRTARKVPACTLLHPTLPPPRIPPHTMDKLGGWLGPSCVMTLVACPWMSASGFPELPSPQLMIKGPPSHAGCSYVPVFCSGKLVARTASPFFLPVVLLRNLSSRPSSRTLLLRRSSFPIVTHRQPNWESFVVAVPGSRKPDHGSSVDQLPPLTSTATCTPSC